MILCHALIFSFVVVVVFIVFIGFTLFFLIFFILGCGGGTLLVVTILLVIVFLSAFIAFVLLHSFRPTASKARAAPPAGFHSRLALLCLASQRFEFAWHKLASEFVNFAELHVLYEILGVLLVLGLEFESTRHKPGQLAVRCWCAH